MSRSKKIGSWGAVVLIALAGILTLLGVSCKSNSSAETGLSSITVTNKCGLKIEVYLDETIRLTLDDLANGTIDNVSLGTHLLEAKKAEGGMEILSMSLTTEADVMYNVTVEGLAKLHVTNQYGEILSIYADDDYLGDIGDQITQTVHKVRFGTHKYEAKTKTDGTVVATITIDVTEPIEYTWVIKK
ncbi:MAG: hypothetical protein OEW18_03970 [Candidatus Aminicenantes bacterium]|nr:hypothetical protein [Candidatus Aminicenantes bacterium]